MKDKRIGFAMCGSFCTFGETLSALEELVKTGAAVQPILSETAYLTDTRFGRAQVWIDKIEDITGNGIIHTIAQAEPIGPQRLLDVLVVAPCTGNTLGKLATGITDTCVTMACKSHLRNRLPVVIAVSTNDGLATAARNIGELLTRKNIYFVPYGQDDSESKPNSLVSDMSLIPSAVSLALEGQQLQPLLLRERSPADIAQTGCPAE